MALPKKSSRGRQAAPAPLGPGSAPSGRRPLLSPCDQWPPGRGQQPLQAGQGLPSTPSPPAGPTRPALKAVFRLHLPAQPLLSRARCPLWEEGSGGQARPGTEGTPLAQPRPPRPQRLPPAPDGAAPSWRPGSLRPRGLQRAGRGGAGRCSAPCRRAGAVPEVRERPERAAARRGPSLPGGGGESGPRREPP